MFTPEEKQTLLDGLESLIAENMHDEHENNIFYERLLELPECPDDLLTATRHQNQTLKIRLTHLERLYKKVAKMTTGDSVL